MAKYLNKTGLAYFWNKIKDWLGYESNPVYYGADPTGIADSTEAIQSAINANKGSTVVFSPGTYKVTAPLILPFGKGKKVSIEGNGARLIAYGTIDAFFKVGGDRTSEATNNAGSDGTSFVKDLYLDGENATVTYAFDITNGFKDFKIMHVESYRTTNGVRIGDSNSSFQVAPADVSIIDCLFYGNGSEYDGVGIISECTDNYVMTTRLYGFRRSFDVSGYLTAIACHGLLRWQDQDTTWNPYTPNSETWNEYYEQTYFAKLNGTCRFIGCYADSMFGMFDINTSNRILITNCFYYNSRMNQVGCRLFTIGVSSPQIVISNCDLHVCGPSDNSVEVTGFKFTEKQNTRYSEIKLDGITVGGAASLPINDLLKTQYHGQRSHTTVFDVNTWYVFACIPFVDSQAGFNEKKLEIIAPELYASLYLGCNAAGTSAIYNKISKEFAGGSVAWLTLGIYTNTTEEGNTEWYLCIKTNNTRSNFGAQLVNLIAGTDTIMNYWTTGTSRGIHPADTVKTKLTDVFPGATPQITFSLDS